MADPATARPVVLRQPGAVLAVTGPRLPVLLLADDSGQVPRLAAFRAAHPEVIIGDLGFGTVWQARIHPRRTGRP